MCRRSTKEFLLLKITHLILFWICKCCYIEETFYFSLFYIWFLSENSIFLSLLLSQTYKYPWWLICIACLEMVAVRETSRGTKHRPFIILGYICATILLLLSTQLSSNWRTTNNLITTILKGLRINVSTIKTITYFYVRIVVYYPYWNSF